MSDIVVANVEWALFFGCMLMAFGPVAGLFFVLVSKRAQLVVISITSAFVWLTSILTTALLWYIITPLKDSIIGTVVISVCIQEFFRFLLFMAYSRAEQAILKVSTPTSKLPLNDITSSLAAGVGFATMQSAMLYGSVLASSVGAKGAAYSDSCDSLPLLFVSALNALAFNVMNVALMIVAFDAYRKNSMVSVLFIVLVHLGASCSTLFNKSENGCAISLPLVFVAAILSSLGAMFHIRRHSSFQQVQ